MKGKEAKGQECRQELAAVVKRSTRRNLSLWPSVVVVVVVVQRCDRSTDSSESGGWAGRSSPVWGRFSELRQPSRFLLSRQEKMLLCLPAFLCGAGELQE